MSEKPALTDREREIERETEALVLESLRGGRAPSPTPVVFKHPFPVDPECPPRRPEECEVCGLTSGDVQDGRCFLHRRETPTIRCAFGGDYVLIIGTQSYRGRHAKHHWNG